MLITLPLRIQTLIEKFKDSEMIKKKLKKIDLVFYSEILFND